MTKNAYIFISLWIFTGLSQVTADGKVSEDICEAEPIIKVLRRSFKKVIPEYNPNTVSLEIHTDSKLKIDATEPILFDLLLGFDVIAKEIILRNESKLEFLRYSMLTVLAYEYSEFLHTYGRPLSCASYFLGTRENFRPVSLVYKKSFNSIKFFDSNILRQLEDNTKGFAPWKGKEIIKRLGIFIENTYNGTSGNPNRTLCTQLLIESKNEGNLIKYPTVTSLPRVIKIPGQPTVYNGFKNNVTYALEKYYQDILSCLETDNLRSEFSTNFATWMSEKLIPPLLKARTCAKGFPKILNLLASVDSYGLKPKNPHNPDDGISSNEIPTERKFMSKVTNRQKRSIGEVSTSARVRTYGNSLYHVTVNGTVESKAVSHKLGRRDNKKHKYREKFHEKYETHRAKKHQRNVREGKHGHSRRHIHIHQHWNLSHPLNNHMQHYIFVVHKKHGNESQEATHKHKVQRKQNKKRKRDGKKLRRDDHSKHKEDHKHHRNLIKEIEHLEEDIDQGLAKDHLKLLELDLKQVDPTKKYEIPSTPTARVPIPHLPTRPIVLHRHTITIPTTTRTTTTTTTTPETIPTTTTTTTTLTTTTTTTTPTTTTSPTTTTTEEYEYPDYNEYPEPEPKLYAHWEETEPFKVKEIGSKTRIIGDLIIDQDKLKKPVSVDIANDKIRAVLSVSPENENFTLQYLLSDKSLSKTEWHFASNLSKIKDPFAPLRKPIPLENFIIREKFLPRPGKMLASKSVNYLEQSFDKFSKIFSFGGGVNMAQAQTKAKAATINTKKPADNKKITRKRKPLSDQQRLEQLLKEQEMDKRNLAEHDHLKKLLSEEELVAEELHDVDHEIRHGFHEDNNRHHAHH